MEYHSKSSVITVCTGDAVHPVGTWGLVHESGIALSMTCNFTLKFLKQLMTIFKPILPAVAHRAV